MAMNCTDAPDSVPSDAGVAGIGVLLSFIVTAAVSLIFSASLIFQEARGNSKPSVLRRKLLSSYSDQQILTGIGIQSVGLGKTHTMASYHFFIIWMLSLLSMAVHNATLLALVHDFRRDWVLRWLRQLLMFVSLVLSCVYGVFILKSVSTGVNDSTLPVACAWEDAATAAAGSLERSNVGASFFGTVAVIAGNGAIFLLATWYLHSRTQRFYKAVQVVGLVLMVASSIGATARVCLMADAFAGAPPVRLADPGEEQWSFGQLLSVGMLLLPLVSLVEILRGEIKCAPPVADDGSERLLGDNELQSGFQRPASFQPNPFFGSQTNLFKK